MLTRIAGVRTHNPRLDHLEGGHDPRLDILAVVLVLPHLRRVDTPQMGAAYVELTTIPCRDAVDVPDSLREVPENVLNRSVTLEDTIAGTQLAMRLPASRTVLEQHGNRRAVRAELADSRRPGQQHRHRRTRVVVEIRHRDLQLGRNSLHCQVLGEHARTQQRLELGRVDLEGDVDIGRLHQSLGQKCLVHAPAQLPMLADHEIEQQDRLSRL